MSNLLTNISFSGGHVRKADLLANHEPLDDAITRYRVFMERILEAQRVVRTRREKQDLAESVLLRLCANWEKFVEHHLVDCVNCYPTQLSEHLGVAMSRHPSRDMCEALVLGDGFRDFRSISDLIGFSKKILPKHGNPFPALSKVHRSRIDDVYSIRNYLSHYSKKSRRTLDKMYKNRYEMSRFEEPGRFLLSSNAKRLWQYFDTFEGASWDLYEFFQ